MNSARLLMIGSFSLLIGLSAFAGDKIGNGGGLWACVHNGQITSAILVDLFEARAEFKLNVPVDTRGFNATELYDLRKAQMLSKLPTVYNLLQPYFKDVENNIEYVQGILEIVDDTLFRLRPDPKTCPNGTVEYVQFANFTKYRKVLIREDLWKSPLITETDKEGLRWHEVVYKMLRAKYGDRDSTRARRITGILMSDMQPKDALGSIRKILNTPPPKENENKEEDSVPQPLPPPAKLKYPQTGDYFPLYYWQQRYGFALPNGIHFVRFYGPTSGWSIQLVGNAKGTQFPTELDVTQTIGPNIFRGSGTVAVEIAGGMFCQIPFTVQIALRMLYGESRMQVDLLGWPDHSQVPMDIVSCSDIRRTNPGTKEVPL